MKRYFILFLLNSYLLNAFSQELIIPSDTLRNYVKYYDLNNEQSLAWKKIEKQWKKEYVKILKEQKMKLNCSSCTSVYMNAILAINADGKMEYYKLVYSDKCGEKFSKGLEIRFMKWFFSYKFPKELYNTKVEVRLGEILKC